jgi:DNA-binding CsgD family transcriptional regulator
MKCGCCGSYPKATASKTIGDRLGISIYTVRNYIRTVYEKLHVHSKAEAVSRALKRRIIL